MELLDGLMISNNIFKKGLKKEIATVTGYNIKFIDFDNQKHHGPRKILGFFVDLVLENETKITCVWKLNVARYIGNFPQTGFMAFDDHQKFAPETPIPVILRSFGVKETKDIIGLKVKVRRNSESIRIVNAELPKLDINEIGAMNALDRFISKGTWLFADMFEYEDIIDVITKERMNDLITIYGPVTDHRLQDLRVELLELAAKFRKDNSNIELPKKLGLTDLFDSLSDLEISIIGKFFELFEKYPEATSELDNLKSRLHDSFSKVDETNIDLK